MDNLVREIFNVLQARGSLSKADIVLTWSLSPEDYECVRQAFASHPSVKPGPQRHGGFRLEQPKLGAPQAVDAPEPLDHGEPWERAAILRLAELLQHKELEDLLGDLGQTLRAARKHRTGVNRRGTKNELAEALLLQHYGVDLFTDVDVRRGVAAKCGVPCPDRWHAGKPAAVAFVHATGFPPELAGIPAQESPEHYEYLEGRADIRPLQDFQNEVKAQVLDTLRTYGGRAIVTLPTGAGKTRVAVESIREWLTARHRAQEIDTVLWLAHSSELCEQAYTEFRQAWQASTDACPLLLFRFWGNFSQDLQRHREALSSIASQPTVLVSTPQRIVHLLDFVGAEEAERAVCADVLATTSLIVIDEAHRAATPTYTHILEAVEQSMPSATVLGLTATPFRKEYLSDGESGTRELAQVFEHLIEAHRTLGDNPRRVLEQRQILARPRFMDIRTATLIEAPAISDPERPTEEDIHRTDTVLGIRADRPQRRLAVLQSILPLCRDPQNAILYFGPSILDAEGMALLLRQERIPAVVVSGETRDVTRRRMIEEFKAGRVRVLCNCEVLTAGFDAPRVTHVVVARPTISSVLYEQMIGRGMRGPVFGGTDECVILDCEDNYRQERPVLGYKTFRHMYFSRAARVRTTVG